MEALAQPKVSVVVVTYGRQDTLEDTLADLRAQSYPDFEILVVDQNPDAVPRSGAAVYQLPAPHLCVARNVGIGAAKGEIVVFVDDDVRMGPGFLDEHVAAYGDGIGCVAGWIDSPIPHKNWRPEAPEPRSPIGCNMSFRRQALEQAGGFDSFMEPPAIFADENELAYRIRQSGWRVKTAPKAILTHLAHVGGGVPAGGDSSFWRGYVSNHTHVFWKTRTWGRLLLLPWSVKLFFTMRRLSGGALGPLATVAAVQNGVGTAMAAFYAKDYLERAPRPTPLRSATEPRPLGSVNKCRRLRESGLRPVNGPRTPRSPA